MKKTMLFVQLMWLTVFGAFAQISFESVPLNTGYWNGAEQSGFFREGNYRLINHYDADWDFWSGFAYSKMTDTVTAGWINQYSVMAGEGADHSSNFAVAYSMASLTLNEPDTLLGMFFTNTTYAYLSMRDGDAYAKKFGGADGNDPDWFKLTITGWYQGTQTDTVNFYLADFRFSDNTQDYILKEWKEVDLTALGLVDSLTFALSSSDTGAYGMNTPAYFAMDNIISKNNDTATFEDLPFRYWNGRNLTGGFSMDSAFFVNYYSISDYGEYASGWIFSMMDDTVTAGWSNLYSAITGSGYDASEKYAVANVSAYSGATYLTLDTVRKVEGFYVTNSTYAYLSMRDGDAFAKKFGGSDGNDPDWFKLTITGWNQGAKTDTVDFYLADFRFADNTQDYILKDWKYVDLTALGEVDSLTFALSSSDTGAYGMNTPAYFCMDNLTIGEKANAMQWVKTQPEKVVLYPNPANDYVYVKTSSAITSIAVYDALGKRCRVGMLKERQQAKINLQSLTTGIYFVQIKTNEQVVTKRMVKR